jgi:hypothetical protein
MHRIRAADVMNVGDAYQRTVESSILETKMSSFNGGQTTSDWTRGEGEEWPDKDESGRKPTVGVREHVK